jgi:NAD(P) transhydrogenase subunit alpha
VPAHASALYAKNLFNLLQLMTDKESKAFRPDWEDEIVRGALLTRQGKVVSQALARGEL